MFAVISFVVGSIFMGIYGTAADTILVCFVMDEEMDPKNESPNAPKKLNDFLNEHVKKDDKKWEKNNLKWFN